MKDYVDDSKGGRMHARAVRTQKIIVIVMVAFAIIPLAIAWMSGSLGF